MYGISNAIALARSRDQPHEILERTNTILREDVPVEKFVTLGFCRLNIETNILKFGFAGMECLFFDSTGQLKATIGPHGLPLNLVDTRELSGSSEFLVAPGDTVLLYTDGLTESLSEDRELFGRQRLIETVAQNFANSPTDIIDSVFQATKSFRPPGALRRDDETAVILRRANQVAAS